jgi:hypothetical protein
MRLGEDDQWPNERKPIFFMRAVQQGVVRFVMSDPPINRILRRGCLRALPPPDDATFPA